MCVPVLAAAVIVAMRPMLMAVLFEGFFLMRMIMPMGLIVLMRMVSSGIIMIGHVFSSYQYLNFVSLTAEAALRAFNQSLDLACWHRTIWIRRIETAEDFVSQFVERGTPVRSQINH